MGYVFPATMTEQISNIKDMEISYRVLHPTMQLTDKQSGRTIEVPFMSLMNKYKDFLSKAIDEVKLNDKLKIKYQYNPKAVSFDLYGTTELWDAILVLNNAKSIIDFTPSKIKYYNPSKLKPLLNELMILEGVV